MPNKLIIFIIISLFVIMTGVFIFYFTSSPQATPTPTVSPTGGQPDLIRVTEPVPDQTVKSPLLVAGEARGYWFFEASFPIRIYDDNGLELGVAVAQAQGEWMTENFVPFKAVVEFKKPATRKGTLVFQKDNPSGLPEHDAELRLPVFFDLNNWSAGEAGRCVIGGCSSQLCVDESEGDIITTCEFLPEYVCYKTAKCERQNPPAGGGKCGWTPTEELVACLGAAFQAEEN